MQVDEVEIFSAQHDVYPLIDPAPHFASKTYKDKVVLVTGGSGGVGATAALFYAKAGAHVVLVARRAENLEKTKATIEKEALGAQVVLVAGDVVDPETGMRAVKAAVETFGRLDIVLANAGGANSSHAKFADKDVAKWWRTQETNVLGALNVVHAALPELLRVKGQVLAVTSAGAHVRFPAIADASISMDRAEALHTLNRFVEILALEYPEIPVYAVHPGMIATPGSDAFLDSVGMKGMPMPDTLELPAATFLWLTARNAEFLSGRFVAATWDLNEVLAKKEEIVRENLLVTKLAGPARPA